MHVAKTLKNGILHLEFSNPPVNSLSVGAGMVDALREAVSEAIRNDEVEAIILSGAKGRFSGGADISDFEFAPERLDDIRSLMNEVEGSPKPIIAVLEGFCLGGGLELAIAAHHRIASPATRLGFPEITLGILPGGGGTQRAIRLVGAQNALELMLTGKPITAARAAEIGLVDRVVNGDRVEAARALITAGDMSRPRPTRALALPADLDAAVATARSAGLRSLAAEHVVQSIVAAADMDFDQGLALEARLFAELMASEPSRALRHGFFGRSIVRQLPNAELTDARPIERVTVIGGGLMGTGIAIALLNAGLSVMIVEPRDDGRERAAASIVRTIGRDAEKGRISREVADRRIASLELVGSIEAARNADLFIEAVFEDMEVKHQVFSELDRVAPEHAILASNTSTLDLDAIAGFTSRPENVVGLHFFSPANVMRLLEVVRGGRTSVQTLQRAMAFARSIGKTGVVAGVCDGFIGNRIFEEYLRQVWFLLEEGALPRQVDDAMERFGFAMGPCRVMDLAGQDIGWSIRKRRAVEQPDRPYSAIPDLVCELDRFGQKTGAGIYLYTDGRTAEPDPVIETLILEESRRIGIERRPISDEEIVERCVYAMVNEGARILEEGIALRPVDIDVVYLDGYGFPAERGGPMFYADQRNLSDVLAAIQRYAARRHGWAWAPAPLLVELAGRGGRFQDLNGS